MASFVEQATLQLRDESTKQINQINAALKRLYATARKMRNMKIDLGLGNLQRTQSQVDRLAASMQRMSRRQSAIRVNTRAIDNALSKAARLQSSLRNLSGRVALPSSGGNVRPPVATQPQRPGHTGGMIGININPLSTLLNGFVYRLGYTIENAIITGFARGTQNIDIARTRLRLQELTPAQMAIASQTADEIAGRFGAVSRGQALGMISETLPIARGNLDVAGQITEQLAGVVQLQTSLGQTSEQASDSAFLFAKAAEQMGVFSDAAGNFDPKAAKQFFDTIKKGQIEIGRELTPELIRGLIKSSRTAKFGFDQEGFLAAMFLAEEQGTSAGVGINQLIKQLTGERIQKKQLVRLQELGLVGEAEVRTGRVGEEVVTERISGGAVDDEGLRRNFLRWIRENVIPVAQREGVDVTNAAQVARFAGSITSDRTATETLASAIVRAAELQLQIQRAMERDVSDERIAGITGESLTTATQEALIQLQSVLGEVGNSFRDILVPALKSVGDVAQQLASFISGPTGEGSVARSAAVAGGAGAIGLGGLLAGRTALSFLNPFKTSAASLTAAGTSLQSAAAALTRAAVAQGAGGVGGVGGGKGKARGMGFLNMLGTAGILASIASLIPVAAEKVEERNKGKLTSEPRGMFAEFLAKVSPKLFQDQAEAQATAVTQKMTSALTEFKERQELKDLREPPAPSALQQIQTISADSILIKHMAAIEREDAARRAGGMPLDQAPIPGGGFDTMLQGMESLKATPEAFRSTFEAGNAALGMTNNSFATTFLNGGTAIATGGQQAGESIRSGMSAGASEAAGILGAAIRNAVSNINVNVNARVNQTGSGLDTGGQAPNE